MQLSAGALPLFRCLPTGDRYEKFFPQRTAVPLARLGPDGRSLHDQLFPQDVCIRRQG